MRKSCKRKPRQILQDPLNYVLNGFRPVSVAADQISLLKIKNHGAIEAVRLGRATWDDVDTLASAMNIAEALAHLDIGKEYAEQVRAGHDAIFELSHRPKYLFKGPELPAVTLALEVLDAQLDDSRTTIGVMDEAIRIVKQVIRSKKARIMKRKGEILECSKQS